MEALAAIEDFFLEHETLVTSLAKVNTISHFVPSIYFEAGLHDPCRNTKLRLTFAHPKFVHHTICPWDLDYC